MRWGTNLLPKRSYPHNGESYVPPQLDGMFWFHEVLSMPISARRPRQWPDTAARRRCPERAGATATKGHHLAVSVGAYIMRPGLPACGITHETERPLSTQPEAVGPVPSASGKRWCTCCGIGQPQDGKPLGLARLEKRGKIRIASGARLRVGLQTLDLPTLPACGKPGIPGYIARFHV